MSKKDKDKKPGQEIAGKGHNAGVAAEQLKTLIERIERLEEEKSGIGEDIKDIFTEAKGNGFDVKTMRKIIHLRAQDAATRDEEEYLLEAYKRALGLSVLD